MRPMTVVLVYFLGAIGTPVQGKDTGHKQNLVKPIRQQEAALFSNSFDLSHAKGQIREMKTVERMVLGLGRKAKNQKDVIRLNCINDKLAKIRGLIRISERSAMAVQEADIRGQTDTTTEEMLKITISNQKIKMLLSESEQCVGELYFTAGKTEVEVEIDKSVVPEQDPTDTELPDTPIRRPPAASPYL